MRKTLTFVLAGAVPSMAGAAFAAENWVGSWKLNAAKSKLGDTAIRVQTLKFEKTAAGIKLTSEGTDAQGKPVQAGYTAKFDGTTGALDRQPDGGHGRPQEDRRQRLRERLDGRRARAR